MCISGFSKHTQVAAQKNIQAKPDCLFKNRFLLYSSNNNTDTLQTAKLTVK